MLRDLRGYIAFCAIGLFRAALIVKSKRDRRKSKRSSSKENVDS